MRMVECCELVVTECAEQLKSVYTQMLPDPRLDPLMAGSRIQPCLLSVHCSSLLLRIVGVAGIVHADDAAAPANTTQVATSHYLDNANKPTTGNLTTLLMMQQLKMTRSRGDATVGSFLWSEANKATVRVGRSKEASGGQQLTSTYLNSRHNTNIPFAESPLCLQM